MRVLHNDVIRSIPVAERREFVTDLQPLTLITSQTLSVDDEPLRTVYFPAGSVVAALYVSQGMVIDAFGVGREGVLGAHAILNANELRFDLVCRVGGPAFGMSADAFASHVQRSGALRRRLTLYASATLVFQTRSATCNAIHSIAQRCARWLLTLKDRVGAHEFELTHQTLAHILGVHRPSVSLALGRLQGLGMITYSLGYVAIENERELKTEACECYELLVRDTKRIYASSR